MLLLKPLRFIQIVQSHSQKAFILQGYHDQLDKLVSIRALPLLFSKLGYGIFPTKTLFLGQMNVI